jgi:hypothetical protein
VSGFTIEFSPWGRFRAIKRQGEIHRWLRAIGEAGTEAFRSGMGRYPPASAPGAWPNSRTGRLKSTIRYEVGGGGAFHDTVTIGTDMPYSIFLRHGTSKMARRKMSDNALKEGMKAGRLGKWVGWERI